MTVQSDLDVNRGVRRILVKHWIDLGRISVRSTQGNVFLRGRLLRLQGTKGDLTSPLVEAMFHDMERVPGVRGVTPNLENWIKDGGRWRVFERYAVRADEKESVRAAQGSVTIG